MENIENLRLLAEQGDSDAQLEYAHCLAEYIVLEEDRQLVSKLLKEMLKYLKMAADQGNKTAQVEQGDLLYRGLGMEKNFVEAAKYYKMAAEQGSAAGVNNYGVCLFEGIGVKKSYKKALEYFRIAAGLGDASAINNYALSLFYGEGIRSNPEEAAILFKMAADGGCPHAQFNYGVCLRDGIGGIKKDLLKASKYFSKISCKEKEPELYILSLLEYHKCLGQYKIKNQDIEDKDGLKQNTMKLEIIKKAIANVPKSRSEGSLLRNRL
jgi:TPR repeat protein